MALTERGYKLLKRLKSLRVMLQNLDNNILYTTVLNTLWYQCFLVPFQLFWSLNNSWWCHTPWRSCTLPPASLSHLPPTNSLLGPLSHLSSFSLQPERIIYHRINLKILLLFSGQIQSTCNQNKNPIILCTHNIISFFLIIYIFKNPTQPYKDWGLLILNCSGKCVICSKRISLSDRCHSQSGGTTVSLDQFQL